MGIGRTAARTVIGGLFIGHGTQKLFGWFGGPGLDGFAEVSEQLGLAPGRPNALAAGASEAGGGALLAAGVATPLAGSALIATMITAIRKVHWDNGPWVTDQGYEYNLVLIAAVLALVEQAKGSRWALASLAAGAAGSTLAIEAGRRHAAAQADEPAEPPFMPEVRELRRSQEERERAAA